jgi:hypothetical protein
MVYRKLKQIHGQRWALRLKYNWTWISTRIFGWTRNFCQNMLGLSMTNQFSRFFFFLFLIWVVVVTEIRLRPEFLTKMFCYLKFNLEFCSKFDRISDNKWLILIKNSFDNNTYLVNMSSHHPINEQSPNFFFVLPRWV